MSCRIGSWYRVLTLILVLALAVPILASCGGGDGEQDSTAKLPVLDVGDSWTKEGTVEGITYRQVITVTGEDIADGKPAYIMDASFDPAIWGMSKATTWIDKETMETLRMEASCEMDGTTFSLVTSSSYQFSGTPFPCSVGKTWEVTEETTTVISIPDQSPETSTDTVIRRYRVESMENITVAAGTFECFKILGYDDQNNLMRTIWYSAEIKQNLKELDNETSETMELVAYSTDSSSSAPKTTPWQASVQTPTHTPSIHVTTTPPSASQNLLGCWLGQLVGGEPGTLQVVIEQSIVTINGQSYESSISSDVLRVDQEIYTYTLNGDQLLLTHTDGTRFQFQRSECSGTGGASTGGGSTGNEWMLQGTLCTWGGSSGGSSSYSRTAWVQFDGQGHFSYGSESSFGSDAGFAYGGSGTNTGTYRIVGDQVQLMFTDGSSDVAKVERREGDESITALSYNGDLYGPELCE